MELLPTDPLPMAAGCALDAAELRSQLERYRQAGAHAQLLERSQRRLVADLDHRVNQELLEEAITIERGCCPWLTLQWEPDQRRLTVSVSEAAHEPALDAIAFALGLATPEPPA